LELKLTLLHNMHPVVLCLHEHFRSPITGILGFTIHVKTCRNIYLKTFSTSVGPTGPCLMPSPVVQLYGSQFSSVQFSSV